MNNEQLLKRIEALEAEIKKLRSSSTIPLEVDRAFRERFGIISGAVFVTTSDIPSALFSAPLTAVTAPSGGATIDSQARTAINSVITRLEDLGLIDPN